MRPDGGTHMRTPRIFDAARGPQAHLGTPRRDRRTAGARTRLLAVIALLAGSRVPSSAVAADWVDLATAGGAARWTRIASSPDGGVLLRHPDGRGVAIPPPEGFITLARAGVGPDTDGDGHREVMAEAWHEDNSRWLALFDAADGRLRVLLPLPDPASDPWALAAADHDGDGRIGPGDLQVALQSPGVDPSPVPDRLAAVFAVWGRSMR